MEKDYQQKVKDRRKGNNLKKRNEKRGYKSLTYLHSGNAASGKVPGDIKNEGEEEEEEEEAPFMKRGLVPAGCSASEGFPALPSFIPGVASSGFFWLSCSWQDLGPGTRYL